MKKSIKILTATLCCISLLVTVSCSDKGGNTDESTTKADETVSQNSDVFDNDTSLTQVTNDISVPGDVSEESSEKITKSSQKTNKENTTKSKTTKVTTSVTSTTGKVIRLSDGLNSTNIDEVLKFYQLVALANKDNNNLSKSFDFKYLDPGEDLGLIGKLVGVFKNLANAALKNNTSDNEPFPGKPAAIRPSDFVSAKAVSDGTYTTIYITVKEQTSVAADDSFDGPVGRTITIVGKPIDTAKEALGAEVQYTDDTLKIYYQKPYIKIKVKNSTGELVKGACSWTYTVDVKLYDVTAKIGPFTFHMKNAEGIVDYFVNY